MFRALAFIFATLTVLAVAAAGGGVYVLWHYGRGLPDYTQLADYQPPMVTRVHAGDGRLLAEYSTERRIFVPIEAMPKGVIKAFLAAEDKNFYSHPGIDVFSMARAALQNLAKIGQNRRPIGASTITQQVARNFLLTNEVSFDRKIKEAILAFRIERAYTKDRILELYLNEIYLGAGSYGVAAAALNYYNKSLNELSVAEAAYLAALPKAPNNYNPQRNPSGAKARRDWVLDRMLEEGFIRPEEYEAARTAPIVIRRRDETEFVRADYFAEEVRRELMQRYGERGLYAGGLSVRTTVDPRLQAIADKALKDGLIAYDRRHGWRGPLGEIAAGPGWAERLAEIAPPAGIGSWQLAVVLTIDPGEAGIGLASGERGRIPLDELRWARETRDGQTRGPAIERASNVLEAGDVIMVEPVAADDKGKPYPAATFGLRQIPDVGGGLVAMDPHTGRVLAMSGGYSYEMSQYNRATQAQRQPGSSFKPFVYLAALEAGYTPSTIILDAPVSFDPGAGQPMWQPRNYGNQSLGPSTLRVGLEKSKNQMTVRVALDIGMDRIAEAAEALGITSYLPRYYSMALGAADTTLLKMTTGYAILVNSGKRITPTLIDRVQDRNGKTIFRHDGRTCEDCRDVAWQNQPPPRLPDARAQIVDPATAYQMVSMMQGVIERGTGIRIRDLRRPLAGKTGTSNDAKDTWFLGFSPDLAVGVFVGFDQPRTLGENEQGSSVAVPIWKDFIAEALKGQPVIPFRIPPGIRLVRVNAHDGKLPVPGDKDVILEAFKPGTEPGAHPAMSELEEEPPITAIPARASPPVNGGGIY
ncbi:MAG: penicillin-binding protein 1A [Proteobacteria bacterium]|nr:penicillin-binding protein 1A [Pseudomonadota bacterium]MBI3498004.1 penicillin-binding protein 1A [Pseudomonadota bacterium]